MAKSDTRRHKNGASQATPPYLTADERIALGRELRNTVPRMSQAGWTPPKDRRDPVELLSDSNEGRILSLIPLRFGRMSESPFAFYRGSAALRSNAMNS